MENAKPEPEKKPASAAAKPAEKQAEPEKKKRSPMFVPMCLGMIGFVIFISSAPFWATDAVEAKRVLLANGYKPISVGGFDPLGCTLDLYATKFSAINPQGIKVHGNVCKTPHVNPPSIELRGE